MSKALTQGYSFPIPNTQYNAVAYSLYKTCNYFVFQLDKKTSFVFDLGFYVPYAMKEAQYIFLPQFESHAVQGLLALAQQANNAYQLYSPHANKVNQLLQLANATTTLQAQELPVFQPLHNNAKLSATFLGSTVVIAQQKLTAKAVQDLKTTKDKKSFLDDATNYEYKPIVTYVSQQLPSDPKDLQLVMQSEVLICPCEENFKNYLEYDAKSAHPFAAFAKKLELFTGKQLLLTNLPERIVCDGYCNLNMYIMSRLPANVRDKFFLVPHRECPVPLVTPVTDVVPSTFPEYKITEMDPSEWEIREFVGYIGSKKEEIRAKWKAKYTSGYTLAYVIPREENGSVDMNDPKSYMVIERKSAFLLYEEGYMRYFAQYPQVAHYLQKKISEVFDTEPENVHCAFDYEMQDEKKATHLQDIAIRRAFKRLSYNFSCKGHLLHVRGYTSEGYFLNPGQVAFHKPHWIRQPETALDFMIPGSIESFWQSNKVLVTRKQ